MQRVCLQGCTTHRCAAFPISSGKINLLMEQVTWKCRRRDNSSAGSKSVDRWELGLRDSVSITRSDCYLTTWENEKWRCQVKCEMSPKGKATVRTHLCLIVTISVAIFVWFRGTGRILSFFGNLQWKLIWVQIDIASYNVGAVSERSSSLNSTTANGYGEWQSLQQIIKRRCMPSCSICDRRNNNCQRNAHISRLHSFIPCPH